MRISLIIYILISGFSLSFCQTEDVDSLKLYPMEVVVVTATRSEIPVRDSPVYVDHYNSADFIRINGSTVADVLKNSSGIFINDLGGGASLKTASLRGTSSQHLLVLVDGVRHTNMQNGIGFLNTEFLSDIDYIEIVHGGNSALYGADAIGGVINIISKDPGSNSGISFVTTAGSHGLFSYNISAEGGIGSIGMRVAHLMERSRDNFKFRIPASPSTAGDLERTNADYVKRNWTFALSAMPSDKSFLRIHAKLFKTEFGVPGSLFYSTPLARQSDEDAGIMATYDNSGLRDIMLTVRAGFRHTLENYRDPEGYIPIDAYYKNAQMNLNPQISFRLTENVRLIAGGEFSEGILYSNDFNSRIVRAQKALYISNEIEHKSDREFIDRIFLFQSIRYDHISDADYAVTPKIGLNLRLVKKGELRFRASAGNSFRVPTFNDLYFRNFSNPDLKPENSTCFDAGLSAEADLGIIQRGALTYFYQDITDRIVFDLIAFKPLNIGKAVSRGVEIRYGCELFHNFVDIEFNYSFTDARKIDSHGPTDSTFNKQLISVPKYLANGQISLLLNPFILTFSQNFVGKRYTTMDNVSSLPSFSITSANLMVNKGLAGIGITLKAEVNNIFNRSYNIFEGYPMPGRTFRGTIGFHY